jgi:H+-translocating NAD(P) transhydrogenase subunit alpha
MLKIAVPREHDKKEKRIAITPTIVSKLIQLGFEVVIEKNIGNHIAIDDEQFKSMGASITDDKRQMLQSADIVLRVKKPSVEDVMLMKKGCIHISFLNPFKEHDIIDAMKSNSISAISLEMMPRTTIAQKMDALSSQANLSGYIAPLIASTHLNKIMPMMTTPSGTLKPATVLVVGVGVAGLQAIATSKRLGANVVAYDTRPVVEEQVKSLGAKFIKIDIGEASQTKDGYAKKTSEEQNLIIKKELTKACSKADIVITTAQIFGKDAPVIIDGEMIKTMKNGSVIIDMAVETGGNVVGSLPDEITLKNGVTIIGYTNLPNFVANDASSMYSSNLYNLIQHFWDADKKEFLMDLENELLKGCLITHDGEITNEVIKNYYNKGEK